MTSVREIELGELMPQEGRRSVNPADHPGEVFELLSIPAYDRGSAEIALGSEIGSTKQAVQPGDVLLSKIVPHIRRAWVVEPSAGSRQIASSEWIVFRSKEADARYLRHFLVSDGFHRQFMQTVSGVGGSLLRARPKYVAKIKIPLPPLEEQRRIAAILNKVAALVASAEQAICLTQDLKKSAVDDFLASTNRDSSSERVKICEVANMITGFPFKSACYTDSADHTRLCRGINVLPGRIEWRQVARWPAVTPELRSYQIQEDDILIAMDRPWIGEGFKIAKARPGDAPSLLVQRVARLRAGDKILPRILYEVLSSKAFEAHCTPTETTVPHISPIEIREYEFPLPLLEKQKELDHILAGIEGIQLAMNRKATLLKEKLSAISREYFL
jgi:type I restriction enzyme S subunit